MKKSLIIIILLAFTLVGCSPQNSNLNGVMTLRESLLSSETCTFTTIITADYGDVIYTFKMSCKADPNGNITFEVVQPESISGITGQLSDNRGGITFDDKILAFETLTDGQIAPVYMPWIMLKALRSGYVRSCTDDSQSCMVLIDDTYGDNTIEFQFLLDTNFTPQSVEIICGSRRIALMEITNFAYV